MRKEATMSNRVAVIGAGMTKFVRRAQESPGELAAQAVQMALEDAGLEMKDIDAVCLGTAPDAFDGIHLNGEHLIAGAGGTNKPYLRHYVGGGTGVFSPIHGWMHVASGKFKNCLVVTEEKMSPCNPHPAGAFITIFDHTTEQPLDLTLIHIFGMEMARFMHTYGYSEEELARISVLCKGNALGHPAAQIAEKITVEDVMNSPMLSTPVKRRDISPVSDGACAVVLSNERVARTHCKAPVFIDGVGFRLDTAYWNTRDLAFPTYVAMAAHDAYKMAGIDKPEEDIDIYEPYDPFNYKALHHMNGLFMDRSGRKLRELFDADQLGPDGSHPICPSGGALGVGNPIAATGLMKIAELYFQLSGQAGKRQVKKSVRTGVAQAWGDLMQVGTVVVMSGENRLPTTASMWNKMTSKDLPGTALKKVEDVPHFGYTPDFRYSWDNGAALTTYLDGFKAGKLRASKCNKCNRMMVPPRAFCELCNLHPVNDYYDIQDTGTVQTLTRSYVDWDSSMLPKGKERHYAVISLDGASDEMGICHWLGEVKVKDLKVGMRVKAVWKPEKDREGGILDIKYFRPLKQGERTSKTVKQIKPTEMDTVTGKSFPGAIPLNYVYTAGVGGTRFFEDLAKGKLSGTYCSHCDAVHIPAANFCEAGMIALDVNKNARVVNPGSGFVSSFTDVFEDRSGHLLSKPKTVVQVVFPKTVGSLFGVLELAKGDVVDVGSAVELVRSRQAGPEHIKFRLKKKRK
ncbi:MAG: thiolase domain-containing protein [bacterium]|nr:thiolase domain-containing protein [bacterium]